MKRYLLILLVLACGLSAAQNKKQNLKPLSVAKVGSDITLTGNVAGTVQFTLYDLQGRRLHRMRQVVHPGSNSLSLPADFRKNQVVIMEMSDGRWKYSEQLVLK